MRYVTLMLWQEKDNSPSEDGGPVWDPTWIENAPGGTKARLSCSLETIGYLEDSQHQNSTLVLQDIFQFYVSPLTGNIEKACFMSSGNEQEPDFEDFFLYNCYCSRGPAQFIKSVFCFLESRSRNVGKVVNRQIQRSGPERHISQLVG